MGNRIDLLLKPLWTNQDIADYCGVGLNVAGSIRQEAIKQYDGLFKLDTKKVKRDAVLQVILGNTMSDIEKTIINSLVAYDNKKI